jgi:hypothetical protein
MMLSPDTNSSCIHVDMYKVSVVDSSDPDPALFVSGLEDANKKSCVADP